jgi:hypothetical protein
MDAVNLAQKSGHGSDRVEFSVSPVEPSPPPPEVPLWVWLAVGGMVAVGVAVALLK